MSKTKITGISTIEFPSTMDGSVMTTTDVSKYVNTLFGKIFADYKGCVVKVDQGSNQMDPQAQLDNRHPISVELYFAPGTGEGKENCLKAFKPIATPEEREAAKSSDGKKRMNFVSRMEMFQMAMGNNKTFIITQDAVDILRDLLWYELKTNLPEGDKCTPKVFNERGISVETCSAATAQQNMYGMPSTDPKVIYGVVRFIDINEIFHLIFGDKEDSRCYYETRPVKPIAQMYQGMGSIGTAKWLVYVNRLNEKSVRDTLTELGAPMATGPNISTASF